MSIATRVKNAGGTILGLAILVGMLAIGIGFLVGAAEFSIWILDWTFPAFTITLLVSIVLLGPLALIPPTRGFSAIGFAIAYLAFGAILWIWGMAYTYSVWGLFAVILGLVIFGVGVVPIAMLAALAHGDWSTLGMLVVTGILSVGCRGLAHWLGEKADERTARMHRSEITAHAYEVRE